MDDASKQLIVKYFNGDPCSPEEYEAVQKLLDDPELLTFAEGLSWKEWNKPVEPDEQQKLLFQKWKGKVNAQIDVDVTPKIQSRSWVRSLASTPYAAVWIGLLLTVGLGLWRLQKNNGDDEVAIVKKSNSHGLPVLYMLPDSSEVFLGAGGSITYEEGFNNKDTRNISLVGEAFFNVIKNPARPFIVTTGDIQTKVLGTSFKITANSGMDLEVAVATGKVSVSKEGGADALAMLTPGRKLTWDASKGKASLGETDVYGLEQWSKGDLVFDKHSMQYIANDLEKRYNISIRFEDDAVQKNTVSGTFPGDINIVKIMNMLSAAGRFRFSTQDNQTFKIYKIN